MNFAVLADRRLKIKESEKIYKFIGLAKKLKMLWNMKVTAILIVIGELGTIPKDLIKGLEKLEIGERVDTIQTPTLLISV